MDAQFAGGHKLRALREALGYTMRDVEAASVRIAQRLENEEFTIAPAGCQISRQRECFPVSSAFILLRQSTGVTIGSSCRLMASISTEFMRISLLHGHIAPTFLKFSAT